MLLYCKGQTYCPLSLENLGGTKILSSLFYILIVPGWGSGSLRLIVSYWSVHGILKHSHVSAVRVIIVCSHFRLSDLHYAPFIWSLSPKTTLPPSYPIHKVTLQNSANRLQEDCEPISGTRHFLCPRASCRTSAGRVTLAGRTTFLHMSTFFPS